MGCRLLSRMSGKECDIWETRDRRAEQWQPVISYSQLDTLWFLFELFERVVVLIVGRISAANSYRT